MMIVFTIIITAIVILLLVRSKQLQDRRRAREAAWFAAARKQQEKAGTTLGGPGNAPGTFRVRPGWLSAEAVRLHEALTAAFPRMLVFSHVSVARILYLKGESDWENQSETARQSVDFLICKKSDTAILPTVVIELDDPASAKKDLRGIGVQKRQAFKEAGIPLLLYAANNLPDVETLRRDVANAVVARNRTVKRTGPA
ncbi:MAG: DUF2726 domain-containing protein [Azoarcus sp.]|jgi:hypothetical protein|nr:DUF2726 domain-containing protein [Azoarcus sp.]